MFGCRWPKQAGFQDADRTGRVCGTWWVGVRCACQVCARSVPKGGGIKNQEAKGWRQKGEEKAEGLGRYHS